MATRRPGRPTRDEPALDRDRIVDAALLLLEERGVEGLTMRELAERLGCKAMSIYHHIPSRDALLDAVAARVMREMRIPPPHAGDLGARLRISARAYLALAQAHPRAFEVFAFRRFQAPEQLDFLEEFLAMLEGAGISRRDGVDVFRMFGFFLNGAGLWWGTLSGVGRPSTGLADRPDPGRFPRIASVAQELGPEGFPATFEAGLDAIVAYAEGRVRR